MATQDCAASSPGMLARMKDGLRSELLEKGMARSARGTHAMPGRFLLQGKHKRDFLQTLSHGLGSHRAVPGILRVATLMQRAPLTVFYPITALCNNICSDKMLTFEFEQELPEFSKRQNTVKPTF